MRFSATCIGTIVFLSALQPSLAIEPKEEEKPSVAKEVAELKQHIAKLSDRVAELEQRLQTSERTHKAAKTEQAPIYTITYKVSDIVPTIKGDFAVAYDFDRLMYYITTKIAPEQWEAAGGPGAMAPYPQNRSLVISQTAEVHKEIAQWMAEYRQAKKVMEDFRKTAPPKGATPDDNISSL